MSENQKNTATQVKSSNESFSGYGLALELAKKIRAQGIAEQAKAKTKQTTKQAKEVKK